MKGVHMITNIKNCKDCIKKCTCDAWKDENEIMLSGWNKNRFAICCSEYKIKKAEE